MFCAMPTFCIMDEATSALDVALEAKCMRMCAEKGITAISVGHRPTLRQFHSRVLTLDGKGAGTIEVLHADLAKEALAKEESEMKLA